MIMIIMITMMMMMMMMMMMTMKQASIGNYQEVDEQIASVLLRTVNNNNDDIDYEVDGAEFDLDISWHSNVDHTPSPSVVDCLQPCFQSSADPAETPQATTTPSAVPRRRRTRQPHTKAAVNLMKAWYDEHRSRPYASDVEVRLLASQCQLGVHQVQKWLSNRRRMDGNTRRRNRPAHNAKSTSRNASVTSS